MLHHSDADRAVEGAAQPAVITELNLHVESATPAFCELLLLA
jgi:hypothetical protein